MSPPLRALAALAACLVSSPAPAAVLPTTAPAVDLHRIALEAAPPETVPTPSIVGERTVAFVDPFAEGSAPGTTPIRLDVLDDPRELERHLHLHRGPGFLLEPIYLMLDALLVGAAFTLALVAKRRKPTHEEPWHPSELRSTAPM